MKDIRIEPSNEFEDRITRLEKQLKTLKRKTLKVRSVETRNKQLAELKKDKNGNLVGLKNISLAEEIKEARGTCNVIYDKANGVIQKVRVLLMWNLILSILTIALSMYVLIS